MPYGTREKHPCQSHRPETYSRADNLGSHVEITDGLQADEDFLFRPFTLRGCERA